MGGSLPFSAEGRAVHWSALDGETFDLLVVGGGITGVATAHDAACRGLSVALAEAGDFARGTSSRSSRLIHGGLRYLETLDLGLVSEALAERGRLLRLAPHLVHPLAFLFPVYRDDEVGPLKLWAGMWLYDVLALFRNIELHRMLGRGATLRQEPELRRDGLRAGALYYDAQVDDARLTLAVARAAHEAGARTVSHAEVVEFLRDVSGTIAGARLRDGRSGEEKEVRARAVLSAAGPWTDQVRRLADPGVSPRLRPTKGVHIVLPRARVRNREAIIFRSALDGRVMFVLPWGDLAYVGTTDTDLGSVPDEPRASPEDIAYLLQSANALLPDVRLSTEDVVSTWAGVRPLLAPEGEVGLSESQTSREHDVWRDPSGLVCIAGGKLTTYRVMAKDAADYVAGLLRREHGIESGQCFTEHLPLPGAPEEDWEPFRSRVRARAKKLRLSTATADHLARAYGTGALDLLGAIEREPALGEPILPSLRYVRAEIPYAVREEMPLSLEDLLQRRLHLFYEAPDGGLGAAPEIAARMAAAPGIGWDAEEVSAQLERYRQAVESARPR